MCDYPWRGNVRELENLVERALIFADGHPVALRDVAFVAGQISDSDIATLNLRDAAELLQEKIRTAHANFDVPVVSDSAATEEQLRNHHLILVERPSANRGTQRFRDALPLKFGGQSFEVCGQTYAHYRSAIIAASANPRSPRHAVTTVAGLSALATYCGSDRAGDKPRHYPTSLPMVLTRGFKPDRPALLIKSKSMFISP
ncbi:MAG: hypothetical protein V1790_18265 [Planctomycetota bacterium]